MTTLTRTPTIDSAEPERRARLKHRRFTRWMHWVNFPILTIMIWSGLRIYWADVRDPFGVGIGGWHWFDLFPDSVNETLGLNRKLARGLAFHLTFGWIFALNGIGYALLCFFTGQWRDIAPNKSSFGDSLKVALHDLKLRKTAPPQIGKYNAAQRLSYSLIIFLGLVMLLTGFAIYKPTQLSLLTNMFGGYENARTIHFFTTMTFLIFFAVHMLQVARAGFSNFWAMVTGYELDPKPAQSSEGNSDV